MELTAPEGARVLFIQHQDDCPPGYVGERVRQSGAQVDVVRAQEAVLPDPRQFDLIVPLGSYDSAYDDSLAYVRRERDWLTDVVESDVPVFGICFGAQLLSRILGGQVYPMSDGPEIGWLEVDTTAPATGILEPGPWLSWHLDGMTTPPGGIELASTSAGTHAFTHGRHFGVQFHPEATVSSVLTWAETYRYLLPRSGTSYDEIVGETRRQAVDAQRRGQDLTDRVLTGVPRRARAYG